MKILCNRQELISACANIQGAVGSSTAVTPALEGILFSASAGFLHMTGYNLELGITTSVNAHVEETGDIVLSSRYFGEIVRRLPDDTVIFETDEKNICTIKSGNAKFSIVGIPASEYPELPTLSDGTVIDFSSAMLESMIRQTRFSVAKTDDKPVYTGILFEIADGTLTLVAVDGFRLAVRKEPINTKISERFIVPEKSLGELVKLFSDKDEPIRFTVGKRHVIIEAGPYLMVSRLLEGDFIDYHTALPAGHTTLVKVKAKNLLDSIDRTALLITDRTKSPLKCIFDVGEIKSSCATAVGNAEDRIEAVLEGERVEMGFNSRFLLDALRAVDCDEVRMEISGALQPLKIYPPEGENFLFLVLPVRLRTQA